MLKICFRFQILLFLCFSFTVFGQSPSNTWVRVNEGLAKCSDIGQWGGVGDMDVDGLDFKRILDRRGETFLYLDYNANGSNTAPCAGGLFRHDTVNNRWVKMANAISGGFSEMFSNNTDIFACVGYGTIIKFNPDYASYPSGWEILTPPGGLRGSDIPGAGCVQGLTWGIYGTGKFPQIAGDTIFFLLEAPCGNPNRIVKFNVNTRSITVDVLGLFPHQGIPATNGATAGMGSFIVTKPMGGIFKYFISYGWFGSNNASRIPYYLWVFDPRNNAGWRNISSGINWMNITGSSNPPQNGWGPCGGFTPSFDKRSIYATSETGIYKWLGNAWEYLGANRENTDLFPTDYGIYVRGRGYIELLKNAVASRIGDGAFWSNACPLPNGLSAITTPDNGKTLYGVRTTFRPGACSNGVEDGVWRIRTDSSAIGTVRNIHLNAATYLGGQGNNSAVNVGIGGKFNVFVGGNFPSVTAPNVFVNRNFHAATAGSPGRILQLSADADSVLASINLGAKVDDFEIQNFGQYRMAVTGSFGVSVFDSTGKNLLWNIPSASLPGNATDKLNVDIDDRGHVVVLRSKTFRLFDENGQALSAATTLGKDFVNDITIKNDTVYVTGFQNDFLGGAPQGCGENRNLAVQVAFIFAYKKPAAVTSQLESIFTTFNFRGAECGLDQADTRGYKINVGKDGKVYYLGEAAGGNSIYRWNGKTNIELNGCQNPPSRLVQYDNYNSPFNTASAHIAFFCTINPRNGEIERGQYIIPRLTNGKSNTYRVRDAYIHADEDGFVYIGGVSAFAFAGRNVQKVNGQPIGTYTGGDMCALVVTPDYKTRTFWGTFSKDTASGELVGFGIRDKRIVAVGNTDKGVMHTKNAMRATPFDPRPNNTQDVYLAVWGQELWQTANNDSIINTVVKSDSIISTDSLLIGARFKANKTTACSDSVVVFTDESIGAKSWVWDFGPGASLDSGTIGKGPHFVKYSTTGLKTVKLTINNGLSEEKKFNYILVQPGNLQLDAISGPGSICGGGIGNYSVSVNTQQSWGITNYQWSLPPGSTILSGANSPNIRVRFGSVSGQVKVKAVYGCGFTPELSRSITVDQGPGPFEAFFVVNSLFLTPGETAIKTYLETNGYNVQTVEDNNYRMEEALCKGLVVISSTVNPNLIDTAFANLPGALVVLHQGLYAKLKLALPGQTGIETGIQSIAISNATHPLSAGFPLGNLGVYNANAAIGWANVSASAFKIATLSSDPNKAVLFAYNQSTALPGGGNAPNKRLGFFGESNLNANGLQLLQKALCWSGNFCDLPELKTDSLNAYFLCESASLQVKYTTNGTFNPGNTFTLQMSDGFGSFVSSTNLATQPGQTSGSFTIQLPANFTTGNRYSFRVVSSNPAVIGKSQSNITLSKTFKNTMVFIGEGSLPTADDQLIISRLKDFHKYDISYFNITNVQEKDLKCRSAIYISNTARFDQQPSKWALIRNLNIPMFIAHHSVLQNFGLTSNNSGYPTENQGSINIVNTNHPITYNQQTGLRPVYTISGGADLTTGGLLNSSATRLANSPTSSTNAALFVYEKDSTLWDGKKAAEIRTVCFLNYRRSNSTFDKLTETGLRIFDQAVCYTGKRGCQVITTHPLLSASSVCVGGELKIPFEVSGFYPFSSNNAFVVELSDPNGNFSNPTKIGTFASQAQKDTISLQIPGTVQAGNNYKVRVTASDGAVFINNLSSSFAITSQQAPVIQVSGRTTLCQGDSLVLSGPVGANSYRWSNGASTASIVVKNSGTFTLQTGQVGGCFSNSSLPVVVSVLPLPPKPTITTNGNTTICNASSFSVILSGPAGFQRYRWASGDTTRSITTTQVGSFSLQVSSNGICFSPASNPVLVQTASGIPAPTITLNGPSTFCFNDSTRITGPAGFAQYLWSNGAVGQSLTVKTAGTYSLVVKNADGCTSPASNAISVSVTQRPANPSAFTASVSSVCQNSSGNVFTIPSILGASYRWQIPPGATITSPSGLSGNSVVTTSNSITITFGSTSGKVSVRAFNSCDSSLESTEQQVEVNTCGISIANVSPAAVCEGKTIAVAFTTSNSLLPGNEFKLQLSDANGQFGVGSVQIASVLSTGSETFSTSLPQGIFGSGYKIRVVSTTPALISNEFALNIFPKPLAENRTIQGSNSLCTNQTGVSFTISSPIPNVSSYKWIVPAGFTIVGFTGNVASGANLNTIEVNTGATGGDVLVRAFNACNDSTADIKLSVSVQNCQINFTPSTLTTCVQNEISFSNVTAGASSYLWSFGAGAIPATSNLENPPSIKYSTPGLKTVKLTINAGIPGQELSKEIQIQVNAVPAQPVFSNSETAVCPSKTISIGVNSIPEASKYVWQLPTGWSIASGSDTTSTVEVLTGSNAGNLIVSSKNECGTSLPANRNYTIVNEAIADVSLSNSGLEICPGKPISFRLISADTVGLIEWFVNNQKIVGNQTTRFSGINFKAGDQVKASISFNTKCQGFITKSTETQLVKIKASPFAGILPITGEFEVCNQDEKSYSVPNLDGYSLNWFVPDGVQILNGQGSSKVDLKIENLSQPDTILVTATDANACAWPYAKSKIQLWEKCDAISIANVFTPTIGDKNSVWLIDGLQDYPNASVKVFNRWGGIVYESTGYKKPWDGTKNGEPLPTAAYYYIIKLNKDNRTFTGSVTIVR